MRDPLLLCLSVATLLALFAFMLTVFSRQVPELFDTPPAPVRSVKAEQRLMDTCEAPPFDTTEARWPCPKIYKYPLPEEWLKQRTRPEAGQADESFPNPYGVRFPGQSGRFLTKAKSMAALLEHALASYGSMCQTQDPEEADLFWIPWWRDWICGARPCDWYTKQSAEEDELFDFVQNFSIAHFGVNYLKRRHGWDHVIIWAQESATNQAPKDMKFRRGHYANITTMSPAYSTVINIPHPTWAHMEGGLRELPWSASHLAWPPTVNTKGTPADLDERIMTTDRSGSQQVLPVWWGVHERKKRYIVLAVHHSGLKKPSFVEECENAPDEVCTFLNTERDYLLDDVTKTQDVADLFASSTFCLQPPANLCTRKGIFDAWTLGCIPVVFQPCPAEFVRDFMDVHRSMVVLNPAASFISALNEISSWSIREMQLYIARNAHKLQVTRMSATNFKNLPEAQRQMVYEDAFFGTFRLAHRSILQQRDCEGFGGRYEARFRACCPHSNECNPMAIVSDGAPNRCATKRSFPCFYDNVMLYHLESKNDDNVAFHDFLRGAQPYEWPPLRKQSTKSHMW